MPYALSDLMRDPDLIDNAVEVSVTSEEFIKEYGIGIDCHSRFIEVCVRYRSESSFVNAQKRFDTDWDSLLAAKSWCITVLKSKAIPALDIDNGPLHYLVESTATYHMPLCIAWEGVPTIINPKLAGATKRKTDVLDAKLLALHDQIGIWRECYIPSEDVNTLRVMLSERDRCIRDATAAGNRINNILTRYGYTVGREGSVVSNADVRSCAENFISDDPAYIDGFCTVPLPSEIRSILHDEYDKYDYFSDRAASIKEVVIQKARSMEWETDTGTLPGDEMIRILCTAPQVGELTAVIWLARIVTPRRFPNSKAVAAYCGLDPSLKISAGKVTSAQTRGGNKALHKALNASAHRLIYRHSEMFGIWGFNLQQQTGKKKKASNAVARKLSVALYYMMKTGTDFSYDNYRMIRNIDVFDIPVDELVIINPDFRRYIRILKENSIFTTADLATAYISCQLGPMRGLGKKFFFLLKDFLDHHVTYKQLYEEIISKTRKEESSNESTKH